ncbi:MAG: hypothetical protein IJX69_03950 [Oscillospiraceae bacterium]|nr:hypothetical protein [Oscillospiraceae bacterium]
MEDTLEYIEQADSGGINDLLIAVLARYRKLHPEDEFYFFSAPRGNVKALREIIRIIEKENR